MNIRPCLLLLVIMPLRGNTVELGQFANALRQLAQQQEQQVAAREALIIDYCPEQYRDLLERALGAVKEAKPKKPSAGSASDLALDRATVWYDRFHALLSAKPALAAELKNAIPPDMTAAAFDQRYGSVEQQKKFNANKDLVELYSLINALIFFALARLEDLPVDLLSDGWLIPGDGKQLPPEVATIEQGDELFGQLLDPEAEPLTQKEKGLLASLYKIHLMPKSRFETINILVILLSNFREWPAFREAVPLCKVNALFMPEAYHSVTPAVPEWDELHTHLPVIVLYVNPGKTHAQWALDMVLKSFKSEQGCNIPPRFNIRVNDLIFYTQLPGGPKRAKACDKFFLAGSNRSILIPTFVDGKTAIDYHLKV